MVYRDKNFRKQYDRERAQRLYEEYVQRRMNLFVDSFNNECFLCHSRAEKGFHLHHVVYHETQSNYPRHSNAMNVRLKRLREAEEHPERFRLLCPACHRFIEHAKTRIEKMDPERLSELI